MFGIKLKEKSTKQKTIKNELNENINAETKVPVFEVPMPEIDMEKMVGEKENGGFNLAHLLGKTESGLKTEFYIYQIKELMKSVGKILPKTDIVAENLETAYKESIRFGYYEISITPFFYQALKNLETKNKNKTVKLGVMLDYPLGESSFKARLNDVREVSRKNVDSITVVFPVNALSFGGLSSERVRLNKLCKVGRKKVGVAINSDLNSEQIKKMIRVLDGSLCTHITLLAENISVDKIKEVVNVIARQKANKKIYVYSSIATLDELSKLLEHNVNRVYTPNLESICLELTKKFGIEM